MTTTDATALIGVCDTCGNITAIDFDDTPEHWAEMQYPGRTVKRLPTFAALALWRERGKRCNHPRSNSATAGLRQTNATESANGG